MFKNIFTIISILFLTATVFAANKTVMVDKASNELKVPAKQTFWEKNISVFRQNKRIYVDMMPSISLAYSSYSQIESNLKHNFWTDTEIKVIGEKGDLLYFTTTINLGADWIESLHNPNVLYDKNPTIYYWYCNNGSGNGCWGVKEKFTARPDNSIGSSMSNRNGAGVTAIWIIPYYNDDSTSSDNFRNTKAYEHYVIDKKMTVNTRGDLIKLIFDDPNNTVLCWRQNMMSGESIPYQGNIEYNTDSLSFSKLWRPCVLEPYGPIEQQTPIDIATYGKENN